mgnify:FL=1
MRINMSLRILLLPGIDLPSLRPALCCLHIGHRLYCLRPSNFPAAQHQHVRLLLLGRILPQHNNTHMLALQLSLRYLLRTNFLPMHHLLFHYGSLQ